MKNYFLPIFFLLTASSTQVYSWGGRGHHTICDAAVYLVKNPELKSFLQNRPHTMGHLCNVPDIYWKSLGSDVNKIGSPTHYIDVEILGIPIKDVPTDFKKLKADFTGKKKANKEGTINSVALELGTNWWRADQFYRRAIALKQGLSATPPTGKEEQNENNEYNKAVYELILNFGLMGHFVGDNSQPYHTTDDYDGYEKGHGGIHSYYEDKAVVSSNYDLQAKVVAAGLKLRKDDKKNSFLSGTDVVEKMKQLAIISFSEVDKVLKADLLIKPSEKGSSKKPAERVPLEKTLPKFEPLIIQQMARSAALLANIWDQAYQELGQPNLKSYKSFKYPFTPDFVAPDYDN